MVKKIKHFIAFVLFSFFYSLLSGKEAKADYKVCLTPQNKEGKFMNKGKVVTGSTFATAQAAADKLCYDGE